MATLIFYVKENINGLHSANDIALLTVVNCVSDILNPN